MAFESSDGKKFSMGSRKRAHESGLRAKQEKQLASYAWVDQKSGVVQLPIDRAMALTAQGYGAQK